ncbi:MAG: ERF family protein [Methylococcales bacterium]
MMIELINKLAVIQRELKAPKNQFNSFGKYNYRSCEDILEGLKLVLNGLVVTVSDDVVMVGDRIYVKATATLTNGKESLSNTAFARESLIKKGMDESQITGTASSYARKYALNGLFLIDDTKDADSMDNTNKNEQVSSNDDKPWYNNFEQEKENMIIHIKNGGSHDEIIKQLSELFKINKSVREQIKGL